MIYEVEYETQFCEDDFPDEYGLDVIEAETEEEALAKCHKKHYHAICRIFRGYENV